MAKTWRRLWREWRWRPDRSPSRRQPLSLRTPMIVVLHVPITKTCRRATSRKPSKWRPRYTPALACRSSGRVALRRSRSRMARSMPMSMLMDRLMANRDNQDTLAFGKASHHTKRANIYVIRVREHAFATGSGFSRYSVWCSPTRSGMSSTGLQPLVNGRYAGLLGREDHARARF